MGDCLCEKHSISHPLLTPTTHEERLRGIPEQGYKVLYHPPGNRWKLSISRRSICINLKIFRSAVTLSKEVINYLIRNHYSPDGFHMEIFAGIPWSQHLNGMGRDGNSGEEVTLRAIANIFGNEIFLVSTLGQQELVHIQPVDLASFLYTLLKDSVLKEHLVLEAKFKPTEEQSDPSGDKSDLITDEINSIENAINQPGNDFNLGKNEINRSKNDISLGKNETNQFKNENNSRKNESNPPENKVFLDETELDQVSIDFKQVENDFKVEQNKISQVKNNMNLRISGYESNNWSTGDTGKDTFLCSFSVRLQFFRSRLLHFPNSINAIPRLNAFKRNGQRLLPRIYINRGNILHKAKGATGEITANVRKTFGAYGGFL